MKALALLALTLLAAQTTATPFKMEPAYSSTLCGFFTTACERYVAATTPAEDSEVVVGTCQRAAGDSFDLTCMVGDQDLTNVIVDKAMANPTRADPIKNAPLSRTARLTYCERFEAGCASICGADAATTPNGQQSCRIRMIDEGVAFTVNSECYCGGVDFSIYLHNDITAGDV